MIAASTFASKKIAVFGMGISGIAAGRSLMAGGATVYAWDDGESGRLAAQNAGIPLADLREQDWTAISSLVLAPGVPLTHPAPHWTVDLAARHGVEVIGDTEIFCRERRASNTSAKLIAITGTNGKSTTTALVHHVLTACGANAVLGGNIGKAVLDLPAFDDDCYYVLEFSSFQLDLTPSLDADKAALLNITPDHLDRHGDLASYAKVKAKIFTYLQKMGVAVIGADDSWCDDIARHVEAGGYKILRVSAQNEVADGVWGNAGHLRQMSDGTCVNVASVQGIKTLRGAHNTQNAAAAMALLGMNSGYDWSTIANALTTFPGLPHRLEEVGRMGNVLFINDSKATNADAAERALLSFDNIYWIAGGKPKDGGIDSLMPHFARVRKAYLIGEAAEAFAATLSNRLEYIIAGTLERALALAAADAELDHGPECVVLLSPACASYDQFPNFEVRGNFFRTLVQNLASPSETGCAA